MDALAESEKTLEPSQVELSCDESGFLDGRGTGGMICGSARGGFFSSSLWSAVATRNFPNSAEWSRHTGQGRAGRPSNQAWREGEREVRYLAEGFRVVLSSTPGRYRAALQGGWMFGVGVGV